MMRFEDGVIGVELKEKLKVCTMIEILAERIEE